MISAIVLAAGAGTRFGGTKQLEFLRGAPLTQHAIDAAAGAGVEEIVVVLGHDADRVRAALALPAGTRVMVNERYADGQSSSLAAGLSALGDACEAAIVLLADQPGISSAHVRALIQAFAPERETAVRLRFRNAPGPALLPRGIWPAIEALRGDSGARALFDARPELVEDLEIDEEAPVDVDRPEDLRRA